MRGICSSITHAFRHRAIKIIDPNPTQIAVNPSGQTHTFRVDPGYPNPFNSQIRLTFELTQKTAVRITIHNIKGQLIDQLVNEMFNPGVHSLEWDAKDFASGLYVVKFCMEEIKQVQRVILLK